jgi:hypothetical protein
MLEVQDQLLLSSRGSREVGVVDSVVKRFHNVVDLDSAAKSTQQQSLQLAPRLRPSCAGITFEGRVGFAMPQRRKEHGSGFRKRTDEEFKEDFWNRIKKGTDGECWTCTGATNAFGYGTMSEGLAHRTAYELTNGPIPKGLNILHRCDNRPCCNPSHLVVGTQAENVADCVSKNRHKGAPGETNAAHLLTSEKVLEMRRIYKAGGKRYSDIAKDFGVSEPCASQAIRGYTWAHLPQP